MYHYTPYWDNQYFLSPYWQTGVYVPPIIPPVPDSDGGGGGGYGLPGRVYGTDDGERLRFILKARADDNELVEILTIIVESGVLNQ